MFAKILVPVDISTEKTTEKLCKTANDLAEKYNSEVILLTVIPDYGMPIVASFFPEDAQKKIKLEMKTKLEKLSQSFFSNVQVTTKLKQGKRRQTILQTIKTIEPDLVMIGCRRKKSRTDQRLLGATGTIISDRAECSVMIVR